MNGPVAVVIFGRSLEAKPFGPVAIGVLILLFSTKVYTPLQGRAQSWLRENGITEPQPQAAALHVANHISVISNALSALVPVGVLLAIVALRQIHSGLGVFLTLLVFIAIAFILFWLLASDIGSISEEITESSPNRLDRFVRALRFRSYGTFLTLVINVMVTVLLLTLAYLELPPAK